MTDEEASIDDRLAALARRTGDLRPPEDLEPKVLAAVDADGRSATRPPDSSSGLGGDVWRIGRVAVAAFAAAAAVTVLASVRTEASVDDDVLATVDVVEMED